MIGSFHPRPKLTHSRLVIRKSLCTTYTPCNMVAHVRLVLIHFFVPPLLYRLVFVCTSDKTNT